MLLITAINAACTCEEGWEMKGLAIKRCYKNCEDGIVTGAAGWKCQKNCPPGFKTVLFSSVFFGKCQHIANGTVINNNAYWRERKTATCI